MEQFQVLDIKKVFESPLNPRRTFNEKKMEELVESIRAKGILMPLLVRPIGAENEYNRFEIAAGHRRYRAATKVKLTEVPVIIREMNDTDFLEVITIENLQREDIEPLDEAQGYRTLMEKSKYDVAAIALKVGKSESYIYQRIKLLELIPEAQEQLGNSKISAGHAILIARLQPQQQKEALKECLQQHYGGKREEAISVRNLSEWIDRNIHLDLNKTSFPKKDANLLPEAGPCTTCPKRTGFAPALFPDIQKKDTCTDPKCFHAKVEAFTERWIQEKTQDTDQPPLRISQAWDGRMKKLPEDSAKPIPRDLYHEIEGKKDRCNSVREAIMVDGHEQGQVKQVCVDPKCEKHHARSRYSSPESQKWKAEQKARQEKDKLEEAIRLRIIDAILPTAGDLSKNDLMFLAEVLFDELWDEHRKKILSRHDIKPLKIQYGFDQMAPMKKHIEKCSTVDLGRLLMEMALIRYREPRQRKSDLLLETATRYKVDPKKIEAQVKAEVKEKKAGSKKKRAKKKEDPPKARTIAMKDLCKLHKAPKKRGKPKSGVCRVCGCTEGYPCIDEETGPCDWTDKTKTLCTACKRKEEVAGLEKAVELGRTIHKKLGETAKAQKKLHTSAKKKKGNK